MNFATALRGSLVIVLVGSALGLAHNALSPNPVPWKPTPKSTVSLDDLVPEDPEAAREHAAEATPDPAVHADPPANTGPTDAAAAEGPVDPPPAVTASADYSDVPESEFPIEISLSKAKSLYDRGGLLVLDARELDEYSAGHIESAECAPYDEMVGDVDWLERTASDPRPILVYCDGTDCELSLNLGFEISQSGHRKVLVLESGFRSWSDAGYPTATGDRP